MATWTKLGMFSLGMTAGAALGILLAPNSGEDSRAYLSDAVRRGVDRAKDQGSKWGRRAQEIGGKMADKGRDYIEQAREMAGEGYNKAKENLS